MVLKFQFKILFLQSCNLSDQYSSSFHVIGKQVKIKYLHLALSSEELSTCQTEAAHVYRDGIPPKICAAVIILALSSSGAKGKYFLTSAQGSLINVTLQFHSRGWITISGVPSKKKWNSTGWFCPPPPSPSIGVGISRSHKTCYALLRSLVLRCRIVAAS